MRGHSEGQPHAPGACRWTLRGAFTGVSRKRSISAKTRLSTGEVSRTTSIDQVVLEFVCAIMARHTTLSECVCELASCRACQLAGFAEGQNLLGVEGNREFKQKTFSHTFLG
jgi:hypothetical protein